MAEYTVLPGTWNGCFILPVDIVDRHLKLASSDAIKVLLYILRNGSSRVDANELASALNIDVSSAVDAIDYWIADGLLKKSDGSNKEKAVGVASDIIAPEKTGKTDDDHSSPAVIRSGRMPSYSHTQISTALKEHPELRDMFESAEEIFARPLSDAVINLLYGLFDWFGLPVDVIIAVLRRCDAQNRLRPAAIKDEAESFYRHGAVTLDAANEYIRELDRNEGYIDEVSSLLHITDHAPYSKEKKAFLVWKGTYKLENEVIGLALKTALTNTDQDKYSTELFPYLQKVLDTWYKAGVRTAADALALQEQKNNESEKDKKKTSSKKSGTAKNPSYDLEQEERLATERFLRKKDER